MTTTEIIEHQQHTDRMWRVVTIHDSRPPTTDRFHGERTARNMAQRNAGLATTAAVHLIAPAEIER